MSPSCNSYLNGAFVAAETVGLRLDNTGFECGDGIFETLRVEDGQLLDVDLHLNRLWDGLARVGIEIPESRRQLREAILAVASSAPRPLARLRATISRGVPGQDATRVVRAVGARELSQECYRKGVAVVLVPDLRVDTASPLCGLKSTSYQLYSMASRWAQQAGAWEGLLVNDYGRVAEGARSNVYVELEGRWVTPALTEGCLPGTIRHLLLAAGRVEEGTISIHQLERATAVLVSNSLAGLVPVGRLEERRLAVSDRQRRLLRDLDVMRERSR